ncbi:MAG: hypothetical protein LWW93_12625 [Hyphomicrobiales bacterium]|nr:hypothetical protein [Hyphomicrobiales bacterium]
MASLLIPLGLAILMAAVGLETRLEDFRALARARAAVALGLVTQWLVLPILAAIVAEIFALPAPLAVGLVLVAAAPGGVTANFVTLMAAGDVALSVSLTVATSLAAPLVAPLWIDLAFARFADETVAVAVPFGPTVGAIFLTTVLPLLAALALGRRRPDLADRARPHLRRLSTIVFAIIVTAAIAAQWTALAEHGLAVGPAALVYDLAAVALVAAAAAILGLARPRTAALVQTTGLRNVAVALTVAISLLGRPDVAVAATVYVFVMNAVALAHVAWTRRRLSEVKDGDG